MNEKNEIGNEGIPCDRGKVLEQEKRLEDLKGRRKARETSRRILFILGVTFLTLAGIMIIIFVKDDGGVETAILSSSVWIFVGVLCFVLTIFTSNRPIDNEIQDIHNELDLLKITEASREQRAEKLFKLHQFELKKYYDQTLRHSAWIFFTGLVCILIGFAIIAFTICLVVWGTGPEGSAVATGIKKGEDVLKVIPLPKTIDEGITEKLDKSADMLEATGVADKDLLAEKIVIAALGAIGGILANFISVIYLKMFSETIKSLTDFHHSLVGTHHLHFANFLVAKIGENKDREKVLADIAKVLAKVPVFDGVESPKDEPA